MRVVSRGDCSRPSPGRGNTAVAFKEGLGMTGIPEVSESSISLR